MGAYEQWKEQKGKLTQVLARESEGTEVSYAVKHALAQVEQNTMATQQDDLLRQQTGILFSCCKVSAGFLDVSVAAGVWVKQQESSKRHAFSANNPLGWVGIVCYVAACIYAYIKNEIAIWLLLLAAALVMLAVLWQERKIRKGLPDVPQTKVTLRVDTQKLFQVLDTQMQAIDRYINDFMYLNEQASGTWADVPDGKMVALVAELLEALYEYDAQEREPMEEALCRMLQSFGLAAVDYEPAQKRLFTVLPSKTENRTIVPAIVQQKDGNMLRRGTAVVRISEGDGAGKFVS